MEIALIGPSSLRLKSKTATLVVDPASSKAKIQADAVMLLQRGAAETSVEGSRLTISGPGEYEVGGIKVTGVKNSDSTAYYVSLDGVSILVGVSNGLKGKESLRDVDIAVLYANSLVDQSALATIASGAALFYGPQAEENIKTLGKEVTPVNKYATTKDKLLAEMEIVLLA